MTSLVPISSVAKVNPRLPKDSEPLQQVSFIPMAAVSEKGQLLEQETRILAETRKGYTYFERGDILVAKITPCFENGKAALTSNLNHVIGFGSTEFHVLRADSDRLDPRFLFYLIWSERFRRLGKYSMQGAAGQKRIPAEFIKEYKIPLPSLAEQKRIAGLFDKAESLRQKRQQTIDLADKLLQSIFLEMFGDPVNNPKGWPISELGMLADCQLGKMLSQKARAGTCPKKYIRNANVRWRSIDVSDLLEMDFSPSEQKKFSLEAGDLLVCEGGEIGRCAVWKSQAEDCYFQKALHRVRVREKVLPEYLQEYFYWMASLSGFDKSVSEVTFSHLTSEKLKLLPVPTPPLSLQRRFSDIYEKISNAKDKSLRSMTGIEELYESLSQRAFCGQL